MNYCIKSILTECINYLNIVLVKAKDLMYLLKRMINNDKNM